MNPTDVAQQAPEDFASEAVTTVTPPAPPAASGLSASPDPLPPTPHGICVNCGRPVTLRRVGTDQTRHTYQWVPEGDPARPGRWCNEGSLPAWHWAADATAAVYHLST